MIRRWRPRGTGDDDEHELTIGQLAGHTGTTVSALRFYEGKGLIESQRNAGNQRRYRRDMARKVGIIRIAQSAGIPLAEIADALSSLPQDRPATEMDWRDVSNHWNARLQRRIDTLLMLRDEFLRYMDVLYSGVEEATERRSAGRNRSPQ